MIQEKRKFIKKSLQSAKAKLMSVHQGCDIEQKNAQRAVVELACPKIRGAAK